VAWCGVAWPGLVWSGLVLTLFSLVPRAAVRCMGLAASRYVPASAVMGNPGSAALYVTPESLKGGGIEVGSLSQLASDDLVTLGGQLDAMQVVAGADATGARVVGAVAFGQFLCGQYRRLTGVVYNDRPVYVAPHTRRVASALLGYFSMQCCGF